MLVKLVCSSRWGDDLEVGDKKDPQGCVISDRRILRQELGSATDKTDKQFEGLLPELESLALVSYGVEADRMESRLSF